MRDSPDDDDDQRLATTTMTARQLLALQFGDDRGLLASLFLASNDRRRRRREGDSAGFRSNDDDDDDDRLLDDAAYAGDTPRLHVVASPQVIAQRFRTSNYFGNEFTMEDEDNDGVETTWAGQVQRVVRTVPLAQNARLLELDPRNVIPYRDRQEVPLALREDFIESLRRSLEECDAIQGYFATVGEGQARLAQGLLGEMKEEFFSKSFPSLLVSVSSTSAFVVNEAMNLASLAPLSSLYVPAVITDPIVPSNVNDTDIAALARTFDLFTLPSRRGGDLGEELSPLVNQPGGLSLAYFRRMLRSSSGSSWVVQEWSPPETTTSPPREGRCWGETLVSTSPSLARRLEEDNNVFPVCVHGRRVFEVSPRDFPSENNGEGETAALTAHARRSSQLLKQCAAVISQTARGEDDADEMREMLLSASEAVCLD